MRKILCMTVLLLGIISCTPGDTKKIIDGTEAGLPPELRGLRIYTVNTGTLSNIKVGLIDSHLRGIEYVANKKSEYIVIVCPDGRVIEAKEIITENDSVMVIRMK